MSATLGSVLVGREDEIHATHDALVAARAGKHQLVVVSSPPGMGKSSLIRWSLTHATSLGFDIASVELHDQPGRSLEQLSYAVCGPAVDPMTGPADGNNPTAGLDDWAELVTGELIATLRARSETRPLLVTVDDFHWADAEAASAIVAMALAAPPRLCLVVALQPEGSPAAIRDPVRLLKRSADRCLQLRLLTPGEVAEMARVRLGRSPGPDMTARLDVAGGHPLFVDQLLRTTRGGDESPSPGTLAAAIAERLAGLPTPSRRLLDCASLLGTGFTLRELEVVSDTPAADIAEALAPALAAHLLESIDDRYLRFDHVLVRDHIRDTMVPAVRTGRRRAAASALADAGEVLAAANQLLMVPRSIDPAAVTILRRAASSSGFHGLSTAARFLEHALAHVRPEDPVHDEIAATIVSYFAVTGRTAEAIRLARHTLTAAQPPELESTMRHALGTAIAATGDVHGALVEFARAASVPGLPTEVHFDRLGTLARARLLTGDLAGADRDGSAALAYLTRSGGRRQLSFLRATMAWVRDAQGMVDEAIELGRQAHDSLDRAELCGLYYGVVLIDADRHEDARRVLHDDRDLCERSALVTHLPLFQWALAGCHYQLGQFDQARSEAEVGIRHCHERGTTLGLLIGHGLLGRIALHRGDLAEARRQVSFADSVTADHGPGFGIDWAMWTKALLLELDGDVIGASELLSLAWDLYPLRYFLSYRSLAPDLVRVALAAGDAAVAAAVTEAVRVGAERSGLPSARGAFLRCDAMLSSDAALAADAAALLAMTPRRVDLAACHELAGQLAATLDPEGARHHLEAAEAAYTEMGASADASRCRPPRSARQALIGPDSLTPAQWAVAKKLRHGLSNRQIAHELDISRHTVDSHLRQVYAKLGVSNRAGAAAALAGLDLDGPASAARR